MSPEAKKDWALHYVLSVLFVIEGLDVMVILQMIDIYAGFSTAICFYMFYIVEGKKLSFVKWFHVFMLLLCISKQFFFAVWVDIWLNRVGVKFLTLNQRTKHACTMSLDGSPKGKTIYGQSSKILSKQKWGIPKKFKVLVHFFGWTKLPFGFESTKYC